VRQATDSHQAGLHQMLRNQSMRIDILEKIAEVLSVPVSVFFGTAPAETGNTGSVIAQGVQNINTMNMQPEERAKFLSEMVDLLRLTTEAQQKVIAAHEAEIKRLKAALNIS
jgi:glycerol-3-phosphate O-acyltransferase